MKRTLLLLLLATATTLLTAQTFPFDSLSGKVGYRQAIKLSSQAGSDKVYTFSENWIKNSPGLFTQINAINPADTLSKKPKNKGMIDREFDNSRPLQMLDPEGERMQALGLVKYYGGTNTSIRLLYIKYDVELALKASQLIVTVSNVRYYHFDPKSYAQSGVYQFGGGKPCDYSGTVDYLLSCQANDKEIAQVAKFFNQQLTVLTTDLKRALKAAKLLYEPTKTPTKTPAKTTTANKNGVKSGGSGKKN